MRTKARVGLGVPARSAPCPRSQMCLILGTAQVGGEWRHQHGAHRPSPYHWGAGRPLEVVGAGQQAQADGTRSARSGAVAALRCCTTSSASRMGRSPFCAPC